MIKQHNNVCLWVLGWGVKAWRKKKEKGEEKANLT